MGSLVELGTAIAATDACAAPAATHECVTTTFRCLVVAETLARREMLARAANDAGWDTIECEGARHGWLVSQRERFQLALVDLEGMVTDRIREFRDFSEQLSTESGLLLVLCGNEGDAAEEIWARQLGAWLYLPGVSDGSDMSALCEQARPVAERLMNRASELIG